ncbi:MAG: hypothetical protein ACLFQX_02130 [Candidatus Kapaibacterium sp.]
MPMQLKLFFLKEEKLGDYPRIDVSENTCPNWKRSNKQDHSEAFTGYGSRKRKEEHIRRLEVENKCLNQQCDYLERV